MNLDNNHHSDYEDEPTLSTAAAPVSVQPRRLRPRKKVTHAKPQSSRTRVPKYETQGTPRAASRLPKSSGVSNQEGSLVGDVLRDSLRLPRMLYPYMRWLIFTYIVWMIFSYAFTFATRKIGQVLQPVCAVPVVSNMIPFCAPPAGAPTGALDLTVVASSQEQLDGVMGPAGQNRDLAMDLVGREYAVRDLKIRVGASDLHRKREMEKELDSLIQRTKGASRGLSRFAAKVSKSVDAVITIDEYVVKNLEATAERQRHPPSLSQAIMGALSPFSAFKSGETPEEELKSHFLRTTTRISGQLQPLTTEAFELYNTLEIIQTNLDRIQELAVDEKVDLPQMDVLASLWTRLSRADDYAQYQSHKQLLGDMERFYKDASLVMKMTINALNTVDAELDEFRDQCATPGLVLKDEPLELIIDMTRNSIKRLERGRRAMDGEQMKGLN